MENSLPSFERAEYVSTAALEPAMGYGMGPGGVEARNHAAYVRGILFGMGAAVVGCALYAGFTILTHIQIGYAGLAVGFLVGKAVMQGSAGLGGRKYQVAAAILTYVSVSMANIPVFLWQLHTSGKDFHFSVLGVGFLVVFMGLGKPFLALGYGLSAVIDFIILFVAMRTAWGLTANRVSRAES